VGELLAAELPPGVLNVLLGDADAGRPLVEHEAVDAVVHVGSVATGREIAAVCARQLKKAVLELGGKDAVIVDDDVDPVWAAGQIAVGAFANAGQICTSAERVYVHAAVVDDVVAELIRRAADTTIGPLIDDRQRSLVHAHVTTAVADGATLRCGGEIPERPGSWYPPTVVTGVVDDTPLMTDETFGPVAAVRTVGSFDEGLELASGGSYGLAGTVLTASQEHAQRAWRELPVGTVKVNAVFGGAPGGAAQPGRGSGLGFGYGPELLDELTHTKVVHLEPAPRR
jgi:succinate-semialdehyde dehydrogenase/glutarate-semialdehyde dehydrogenase